MATRVTETIVKINTAQGAKNLRDLQRQIDITRAGFKDLDRDSEAYQQQLVELKKAQGDYNAEMRLSVKEMNAQEGSYNDLVNTLARLKQEWKATGDEARRGEITKEVNAVKEKLTALDNSIGNYQRNVGNYENAIIGALKRMGLGVQGLGLSFKALIPTIKAVGASLWALAKNPFIIGLTAIVALFNKLTKSLKNNEEAYDRIRIALAPLKAVTIAIQKVFDRLVGVIADAAEGLGRFLEKMGLVKGTGKELKEIATLENEVEEMRREYRKADARDMKEINRLRAEERKTNKYTAQERKQMLQQAIALELAIGARREELARKENEAQSRRAALTANSRETNDALAESEAKVDDAMAQAYGTLGRMTQRLDSLEKGTDSAKDSVQEMANALLEQARAEEEAADNAADLNLRVYEKYLEGREKAEKAAADRMKRSNDAALAGVGTRAAGQENTARATIDDERALVAELYRIRKESNEQRLALLRQFAQDALKAGNMDAYLAYDKQAADLEVKIAQDAETEKARIRRQDAADAKKAREKELKDTKEHQKQIREAMTATANIFGDVASAYSAYLQQRVEGGKISQQAAEQEFKSVKTIQYAQTWINTLAGMMSVWAGEGTNLTKAVQSAAVLAQGTAATMQIANTTLGSVAAASQAITSAAVAAPVVINAMPQVQTMTSASQEDVLNARSKAQRVYVVYSDIAQAGQKVAVTDRESRF